MSHTYVEVRGYPQPAVPRGALLVERLSTLLSALFAPRRAAPGRRAAEAQVVREMAQRLQDSDPSFAADLLAAALRHESLDDLPAR